MRLLRKQVKNEDLLYLVEMLLRSYRQGLSIGSYLSQWLCNYYLSFAYHYAEQELAKVRKSGKGQAKRVRLIYAVIFYMDDILILGSRKADVRKAMLLWSNSSRMSWTWNKGKLEIVPGRLYGQGRQTSWGLH